MAKIPLEITFRDVEHSPALEERIRESAAKLERFSRDITGCHVIVEAPHRHHQKGRLYHVRIDMTLPGREIAVTRDPGENHAHEDAYVAVRDAFAAAARRVEDFVGRRRDRKKRGARR
jgi:ribosome-associated translation inhibitor RaiA